MSAAVNRFSNRFPTVANSRRCPTCGGTGINPVATYLLCPKCNGEKVVSSAGAGRGGNNT